MTKPLLPPAHATSVELDLLVDAIVQEADRVASIHPVALDRQELPAWTPGAHSDVLLDGHLERHYSLCGDPADRRR